MGAARCKQEAELGMSMVFCRCPNDISLKQLISSVSMASKCNSRLGGDSCFTELQAAISLAIGARCRCCRSAPSRMQLGWRERATVHSDLGAFETVPEPASATLILLGVGVLLAAGRKARQHMSGNGAIENHLLEEAP
jgi:hypothetical protein